MTKKVLFAILLIVTIIAFSITYSFATNDNTMLKNAVDGVRNFVGGAEKGIENAARDVSNTSKNITGDMQNGMNTATDKAMNMTGTNGDGDTRNK